MTVNTDGLPAHEIAQAVAGGELSALDATEAALARIARHDPVLNSFTDVTAEHARAKARAVDAAIAAGQNVGPLAGVPFTVKDCLWVEGKRATQGSLLFRDFIAPHDAIAVEWLRAPARSTSG